MTIRFYKKILIFVGLLSSVVLTDLYGQTSGLSYQAVILSPHGAQAPGFNPGNIPLSMGDVKLRFFIINQDDDIEYIEEIQTTTDEFGMIATAIGVGIGVTSDSFDDVLWDGTPKSLRVEIDIDGDSEGFVFLDEQPIITIPVQDRRLLFGQGQPTELAASNALYADTATGTLYVFNGTAWIKYSSFIQVSNGLTKDNNGVLQLGGFLNRPTVLEATNVNTLGIKGLEKISLDPQHSIVATNDQTGVLKTINTNSLVQAQEIIVQATEGQYRFDTPLSPIQNNKLSVYRNGVKIGFIVVDDDTIELNDNVVCFANDEIRIVQIY